jgi:glycosyltransferase involved in cell wall biosynthesis
MRVLAITKIFPNAAEPFSSPFNRQQLGALAGLCDLEILATIPWFPGARALARWSPAGRLVDVPEREQIDGLEVEHPRFLFVPRLPAISGVLYAASLLAPVRARRGRVDVVLGSWAYPDGFAAILLAERLGVPAVVKVHGSDINVVAKMKGPRRALSWALPRAARVVAVSRPLADAVAELGVARERIELVRNGVNTSLFCPHDRSQARRTLGLPEDDKIVLYVGRLEREKGVFDLVEAYARMGRARRGVSLVLLGGGVGQSDCERLARQLGVDVRMPGAVQLAEVPNWLAACDVFTLPSWNEGTPNVVLEALACGRRVVATRVGGVPDVVESAELGELVPPREPAMLAEALIRAVRTSYAPERIVGACAPSTWTESAERLHAVLAAACAEQPAPVLASKRAFA